LTISVDWPGTSAIPYQITVEKADMALIEAGPPEIYELDVDAFRLTLRDLEDDPDGRPWPKTHRHNTEVILAGVTYARTVEILAPYSVTFEDGQYAVVLSGANANVHEVANVNQVSVRSNNSAGLISAGGDIAGVKADTEELLTRLTLYRAVALDNLPLMRKIMTNRLELEDGVGLNWVLYDDDGETWIMKWPVRDKNGKQIFSPVGIPARRGEPTTP
jgi:hypothetical protein